ncbi:energy transducer TonB [Rhizobium sp. AAP43]|uniref:energy transducer TonB n=1 Tax=Rhizobium sp. AAP43 TaxID=1523420 RepID=UPI0006B9A07E|nr:energy transducer TonB [Rhizobium sp. AAP43]KPF43411.1 energy transducer TonB [Rhizobium sp. AAP43]
MTMLDERRSTGRVIGEWALWTSAFVIIGALHAGAVALLLQEPDVAIADGGPPPAIMIELAPEPEAVNTEETELTTEEVDAEEVKTATAEPIIEPVVEPPPEPMPEPLPPEPLPEPEPEVVQPVVEPVVEPLPIEPEPLPEPVETMDPIEELVMAQLENVEVPVPMMRPKPAPEKKPDPVKKQVVKKQKPQAQVQASQAARKAEAQVAQSNRNAAAATSNSTGRSSVSPAKWQSRLASHLERRKKYPPEARRNREEGTVYVRFKIDDSGNVLTVSLSRSSGSTALDNAVLDMVRRASPVPAPPAGVNKTITTPVRFNIR